MTASPQLGSRDMRRISALIYATSGIALRDSKRTLVLARLQKRLRRQGFSSFGEYVSFLETDRSGRELAAVLDAITTNHTGFFREPDHFHFLADHVLPALAPRGAMHPVTAWSAACATGEELYSMAIAIMERLPPVEHARVRILGSDLSSTAIRHAHGAVYAGARVAHLPRPLLHRYFERGMGKQEGLVRVKADVRRLTEVRHLNLMDVRLPGVLFDVIFCRNAMIYFDRQSRQRVVSMLERQLAPHGWLFVSHSEGLTDVDHRLKWCAPGIYRRVES
jgi:chemotaxis protein methyltransferase CheR